MAENALMTTKAAGGRSRSWLRQAVIAALCVGLWGVAAVATDVTNGADNTADPPVAGSLRAVIAGINASPQTASSPINIRVPNITLLRDLPAITKTYTVVTIDSTESDGTTPLTGCTISANWYSVFTGPYSSIGQNTGDDATAATRIITINSPGTAISITGAIAGCRVQGVTVNGGNNVGIAVGPDNAGTIRILDCQVHGTSGTPRPADNIGVTKTNGATLIRRVKTTYSNGAGIRVSGTGSSKGYSSLRIGNRADSSATDTGTVNAATNPSGAFDMVAGSKGVWASLCAQGGIVIGASGANYGGYVAIDSVRCGSTEDGTAGYWYGASLRRWQRYGLQCYTDTWWSNDLYIINSQFSGNYDAGIDINGNNSARLYDNVIGLAADGQTTLKDDNSATGGDGTGNGYRVSTGTYPYQCVSAGGCGLSWRSQGCLENAARNVITGNAGDGVYVSSTADGGLLFGRADSWSDWQRGADAWVANYIGVGKSGRKATPWTTNAGPWNAAPWLTGAWTDTPMRRGNGTTIYSGANPTTMVGSGIRHEGNSCLAVIDAVVSDNADWGIDVNSGTGSSGNAALFVMGCKVGTDTTGDAPTQQQIGNGTVLKDSVSTTATPLTRSGSGSTDWSPYGGGIRISRNGRSVIGAFKVETAEMAGMQTRVYNRVGSAARFLTGDQALNANVISSNVGYGVLVDSGVDQADSSVGISNNRIGLPKSSSAEAFGNGHMRASDLAIAFGAALYPAQFGAGIRFNPGSRGRHMIGGDDAEEANVISGNPLTGIWINSGAVVSVVRNVIGPATAAQATPATSNPYVQAYGVLVERSATGADTAVHVSYTGTGATAQAAKPGAKIIGALPSSDYANANATGTTGGPGYYANVIGGNALYGVAIDDAGDDVVVANTIQNNGRGVLGNAPRMGDLAILLLPTNFAVGGGVSIGALNQSANGTVSVGDDGMTSQTITLNTGHGVAQYRNGVLQAVKNTITSNTYNGVYVRGDGVNKILRNTITGNGTGATNMAEGTTNNHGIKIDGSGANELYSNVVTASRGNGLYITAHATGNNTIGDKYGATSAGAQMRNVFGGNLYNGIRIDGSGANVLRGNLIGILADGTAAGNGATGAATGDGNGIKIIGSGANQIGGSAQEYGNTVGSNSGYGIHITAASQIGTGSPSTGGPNRLQYNLIGVALGDYIGGTTGATTPRGNVKSGVVIDNAGGVAAGGIAATGARSVGQNVLANNTISGNSTTVAGYGVLIDAAGQNTLTANKIGVDWAGAAAVPNGLAATADQGDGVRIAAGTTVAQRIGLPNSTNTAFDNGNVISGNAGHGIAVLSNQSHEIKGNRIGTNLAGTGAVGNALAGIYSSMAGGSGAGTLYVGGPLTGEYNVISGNTTQGIYVTGDANQNITANRIGLVANGGSILANTLQGIWITGTVGANQAQNVLLDNTVSGNQGGGIRIDKGSNTLQLNRVGTDLAGATTMGNTGVGVWFADTTAEATRQQQVIGVATQGNVISGNTGVGLRIDGEGAYTVISNVIGLNLAGTGALSNLSHGIHVTSTSGTNGGTVTIGGNQTNQQNSISGNLGFGIYHEGKQSPVVMANRIGLNANGTAAVAPSSGGASQGNVQGGIYFGGIAATPGAAVTLGGTGASDGNLISGNGGPGVVVGTNCNQAVTMLGNKIGTNLSGAQALGNSGPGVLIQNGQANVVGNATVGNVISGNGTGLLVATPLGQTPLLKRGTRAMNLATAGIHITGNGSNTIQNNSIGCSANGSALVVGGTDTIVGNTGAGVYIERSDASVGGSTVKNNLIRYNGAQGIAVKAGGQENLTGNLIQYNGYTRDTNNVVTDVKLPIDLGADDLVNYPDAANHARRMPTLTRLVPTSTAGQAMLYGVAPVNTTSVEIYLAEDPIPTDASAYDATVRKHHGGTKQLLTTVQMPITQTGDTAFQAQIPVAAADLVCALAFDRAGNTSEFSRNIGLVSTARSTIAASPTSVIGNGTDTSTVTVTLRDAISTPLEGVTDVTLAFTALTGLVPPTGALAATNASGVTSGTVKCAGQGSTTVTATTGGQTLTGTNTTITFTPASLDLTKSTFQAFVGGTPVNADGSTQVRADGATRVTFTFTMRDVNNQPIPNMAANLFTLTSSPAADGTILHIEPLAGVTNASGQISTWATCSTAQSVTFTGAVGANTVPSPATVRFVAIPFSGSKSTLVVTGSPLPNDNTSEAKITLTLKNDDGNAIAGIQASQVTFTPNTGSQAVTFRKQTTVTDASGVFVAWVKSAFIQTVTITAAVDATAITTTGTVQFTAGAPSPTVSSLTFVPAPVPPAPATTIADDTQLITVVVTVVDQSRQGIANQPVTLSVTNTDGTAAPGLTVVQPALTDANGVAQGTIKSKTAGIFQVTATVGTGASAFTLGPSNIAFTPNPPDKDKSKVALSPAEIAVTTGDPSQPTTPATEATVTITLIDGQGRALAGVDPATVVVAVSSPTGVTLTQPTTVTDSNGQTTAKIKSTVPGVQTVTVVARAIPLTTQPQLTVRNMQKVSYAIGTYLAGLPVTPVDARPEAVFSALLPNLRLARWNAATSAYVVWSSGMTSDALNIKPGRGFWLQLGRALDLWVQGEQTADGPFTVDLQNGWNQVGNPYTGQLAFTLSSIEVLQNNLVVGTLGSTAGRNLVDPYGWIWDPVKGYLLVVDPTVTVGAGVPGAVEVGRAIWLRAKADNVSLRFNGPTRAASAGRARSRQPSPSEWLVTLQAAAGDSVAQTNVLGVGSTRMTAALPPDSPAPVPVRVMLKDETGQPVAADVRTGPITRVTSWNAVVTAPAQTDVTLSWPSVSRGLPAGHRMWLVDPTNGKRTLMNTRTSYQYRNGTGNREFRVEVDPRGQRSLVVQSMGVKNGASRGRGIPVEFTISVAARYTLTVKGLRGTVVRSLTGEAVAGLNQVGWDRLDNSGRLVPAGVYQLELTVNTDEGEISKVTRTVTVE